MTIVRCDRCHCTIRNGKKANAGEKIGKYVVIRTYQDGTNVRSIYRQCREPLDLCSDCARHLTQFIEGYADVEADQGNDNEI